MQKNIGNSLDLNIKVLGYMDSYIAGLVVTSNVCIGNQILQMLTKSTDKKYN